MKRRKGVRTIRRRSGGGEGGEENSEKEEDVGEEEGGGTDQECYDYCAEDSVRYQQRILLSQGVRYLPPARVLCKCISASPIGLCKLPVTDTKSTEKHRIRARKHLCRPI